VKKYVVFCTGSFLNSAETVIGAVFVSRQRVMFSSEAFKSTKLILRKLLKLGLFL